MGEKTVLCQDDGDNETRGTAKAITHHLLELLSTVPASDESAASEPLTRAKRIVKTACVKSAAVSGGLAMPPGPIGMLTILPDLGAIWNIQRKMVADIAAAYGKTPMLTREAMIFCLFKHAAVQAVRDLVVRVGGRVLVKRVTLRAVQRMLGKIGIRITQRVVSRTISRWLPIVGAIGIAAYAFYDTKQVGKNAIDLFSQNLAIDERPDEDNNAKDTDPD